MSTTYSICCPEMNIKFWIGQSRVGVDFYVYTTEPETEVLSQFLKKTEGKNLMFVNDYCEEDWFLNLEEYKGEGV